MARRAHLDAVDGLLRRIVAGDFPPGERLPKELAVAEQYGIHRGTAREALRALEERHVAIVKHGRGATVQDPSTWNVLDPAVAEALLNARGRSRFVREIHDARGVIESELAARAAANGTRVDHAALAAAMSDDAPADAFAVAIGRLARNRPLASVAAALRRIAPPGRPPEKARNAVLDAVTRGDADAARDAMRGLVGAAGSG